VEFVLSKEQGTADSLLKVKDMTRGDVLVMSGDAIIPPESLRRLVDTHVATRADATVLLAKKKPEEIALLEKDFGSSLDFIALDPETNKVAAIIPAAGVDESVKMNKSVLRK